MLWSEGVSPYSPAFTSLYLETFGPGPVSHFWVYPPSFHPLAGFLARFDFTTAVQIWNILNYSFLHIASAFIALAVCRSDHGKVVPVYLFTAGAASLMQATPVALAIGQTSFLVYLGIALFLYGFTDARIGAAAVTVGLILVGHKPSVGIVLLCAALAKAEFRSAALLALLCHAVLSAVSALNTGLLADMSGFTQAVLAYGADGGPANAPPNLVGLTQLADLAGADLNGKLLLLIACITSFLAARRTTNPRTFAIALVCIIGLLVTPLHTYDLTFAAIALAVALSGKTSIQSFFLIMGFALLFRPDNLWAITGLMNPAGEIFPGSLIATMGLLILPLALLDCRVQNGG